GHVDRKPFSDTWVWDGENWHLKTPRLSPPGRYEHAMAYDTSRNKIVVVAGKGGDVAGSLSDTWLWDGEEWALESAVHYVVDMETKPDGVWNFTSVHVPEWATVSFGRNSSNTPVQWLATETVLIEGTVNVSGKNQYEVEPGEVIPGGPGGFDGGRGGTRFLSS